MIGIRGTQSPRPLIQFGYPDPRDVQSFIRRAKTSTFGMTSPDRTSSPLAESGAATALEVKSALAAWSICDRFPFV